jgi:hypothetical protein
MWAQMGEIALVRSGFKKVLPAQTANLTASILSGNINAVDFMFLKIERTIS